MEISLSDFSYYFGLTGNSGGLASMELEFRPCLYKGQKIDDIKAAARGCVDKYMEVLDPLYNDVIDGKKEPQLTEQKQRQEAVQMAGSSHRAPLSDVRSSLKTRHAVRCNWLP